MLFLERIVKPDLLTKNKLLTKNELLFLLVTYNKKYIQISFCSLKVRYNG